jgi:hypothetical protein
MFDRLGPENSKKLSQEPSRMGHEPVEIHKQIIDNEQRCYLRIAAWGDWSDPGHATGTQWEDVYQTAGDVLKNAGFFEVAPFDDAIILLDVNGPSKGKPIQITSSRAHRLTFVKYFVKSGEMPSHRDAVLWRNLLVEYLADGVERLLKKYHLDTAGVASIRAFALARPLLSNHTATVDESEDDSAEIELYLPYQLPPSATELELADFNQFSDSLLSDLEGAGIAKFVASESTREYRIIVLATREPKVAIEIIKGRAQELKTLAPGSFLDLTENGTQSRISL